MNNSFSGNFRIDAEIIVGILKKNLGDFSRFNDAVLAFLEADR